MKKENKSTVETWRKGILVNKENKLILQVKGKKEGQKRVTIPKESTIEFDDYVEVKKHE